MIRKAYISHCVLRLGGDVGPVPGPLLLAIPARHYRVQVNRSRVCPRVLAQGIRAILSGVSQLRGEDGRRRRI